MNKRIAAYPEFEQLKNSTGTLQFGMFTEQQQLIIGYSINAGSSLNGDRQRKSASLGFLGLSADVGYKLSKSTLLSVYPFTGLCYVAFTAKYNKDISAVPFDSVLRSNVFQQEIQKLVFNNSFLVYRLGVGFFITSKKNVQNSIGLQIGRTAGFTSKEWKINKSQTLLNSPKDNIYKLRSSVLIRYQFIKKQ